MQKDDVQITIFLHFKQHYNKNESILLSYFVKNKTDGNFAK